MSASINHQNKKIESWALSDKNDLNLILNGISNLKFSVSWKINSDNALVYSTEEYIRIINSNNGTISKSRPGNCLDNREIEYFWSCLKSEWLSRYNIKKLSFKQLKALITEYILIFTIMWDHKWF